MHRSWIEPVLDRHLGEVAAPDELWDRVRTPVSRPRPVLEWKLAFALMAVIASAWALHPRAASIQSDRASEIQQWMKTRCGLDVPLTPAVQVRLLGARQTGAGTAEIRYRLHDREATVLVSKAGQFTDGHRFVGETSWIWRGQLYTVASADFQAACLLCHADGASALN